MKATWRSGDRRRALRFVVERALFRPTLSSLRTQLGWLPLSGNVTARSLRTVRPSQPIPPSSLASDLPPVLRSRPSWSSPPTSSFAPPLPPPRPLASLVHPAPTDRFPAHPAGPRLGRALPPPRPRPALDPRRDRRRPGRRRRPPRPGRLLRAGLGQGGRRPGRDHVHPSGQEEGRQVRNPFSCSLPLARLRGLSNGEAEPRVWADRVQVVLATGLPRRSQGPVPSIISFSTRSASSSSHSTLLLLVSSIASRLQDSEDENAQYTALRETWEEVGIDLADKGWLSVGQLGASLQHRVPPGWLLT